MRPKLADANHKVALDMCLVMRFCKAQLELKEQRIDELGNQLQEKEMEFQRVGKLILAQQRELDNSRANSQQDILLQESNATDAHCDRFSRTSPSTHTHLYTCSFATNQGRGTPGQGGRQD